jgi:hypothetical protein
VDHLAVRRSRAAAGRGYLGITKLARADVLRTQEAARLLAPFIEPLPSFEELVLGKAAMPTA